MLKTNPNFLHRRLGANRWLNRIPKLAAIVLIPGFILLAVYNFRNNFQTSVINQSDFLESYYKNINDYEGSFAKFVKVKKQPVLAAITSHHFLAKDLIAQTFAGIDPANIETVIIVSPDHFFQVEGNYLAQTTDAPWQTPYGNMNSNFLAINTLLQNNRVKNDVNAFRLEHGIYTLIPFAKKTFPKAKIVPLVLRQKLNYQFYYDLGKNLYQHLEPSKTILIVSSDFSHDSTREQAKLNDQKSIKLLKAQNFEAINSIENDCRQCLAFLYGCLDGKKTNFELINSINSYDISGENPESVTSYVSGYFIQSGWPKSST